MDKNIKDEEKKIDGKDDSIDEIYFGDLFE